jgi:hypothetical protein
MNNPNEPRTPTEAQINANRENAKKSTGPRTAEGKSASSRNRLLHGLRANKHILLDEDPEEFLFLLDDHLDRFHDVAAKEERRQDRYATKKDYAEEDGKPAPPPPIPPDERDLPARAFNVDCEGPNSFTKLARYETSIERSIDRCLRQLKTYQAARAASTPRWGRRFRLPKPIPPKWGRRPRVPRPQRPPQHPRNQRITIRTQKMGVSPNSAPLPWPSWYTRSWMPCRNSSRRSLCCYLAHAPPITAPK